MLQKSSFIGESQRMEQDFGFGPNGSCRTHRRSLQGTGSSSGKFLIRVGGGVELAYTIFRILNKSNYKY